MAAAVAKLAGDSLQALLEWRVWLFLGMQDVKARFRRSFLGPLWLLLNTAFFVAGVGLFYGLMFAQPLEEFIPFLTAGIVVWSFLLSSFVEGAYTFVVAEGYIKQFCYPKQIYVLRSLAGYSVALGIGLAAIVPVQAAFGKFSATGWLLALPGLMILLLAAVAHISICAYLGARFRDLPHALSAVFQVLFFVTPIMFPVQLLKERHLDFVYRLNPLYYLIDIVRHPIVKGEWAAAENYLFACLYLALVWLIAAAVARRLDARVVFLL